MRSFLFLFTFLFWGQLLAQEDTTVYELVDQEAQFPGGSAQLLQWITNQEIQMEEGFLRGTCSSGIQLQFIVEKDGTVSNVKSLNPCSLSQENAVKLMQGSPEWIPAIANSQKVRSIYRLPVTICFSD